MKWHTFYDDDGNMQVYCDVHQRKMLAIQQATGRLFECSDCLEETGEAYPKGA